MMAGCHCTSSSYEVSRLDVTSNRRMELVLIAATAAAAVAEAIAVVVVMVVV